MDTIETRVSVRGYELDADGLLPPHVWLRYMEHLRWLAVGSGPEALAQQFRGGQSFVVVAQGLSVRHDVSLGTELDGALWPGRFGRTSADLYHAFFRRPDRELVAVGMVTAVYLENGKPTPIPDGLRRLESAPPTDELDLPTPLDETPPAGAHRHSLCVRPADLDLLRHANHSSYSVFADAARHAAAAANAYGDASSPARGRLAGIHVQYLAEALYGEELTALTWALESAPLSIGCEIRRETKLLSRVRMVLAGH